MMLFTFNVIDTDLVKKFLVCSSENVIFQLNFVMFEVTFSSIISLQYCENSPN